MAFCFSGSPLRANINIVFFLFYIVIVRGKQISSSSSSCTIAPQQLLRIFEGFVNTI